ncbi:MAG: TonB-dependent receptor [Ferruginibacter sp.]
MRKLLLMLAAIFLLLSNGIAQTRTITGKITDEQGLALSGVSVVVKGSRLGTSTNAQGEYTLTVPADAKTLVISSVSMETISVSIASGKYNVAMRPGTTELEGVVVTVPYGTIKKTAFTGSENTISSATIQKQQVTDVTKAIEGLVPGIIATNGGGQPGTGAALLIRGVGSVNANSAPLYVLNGVPYDGSITSLSTDDIESVTVLKDAAAASLYGSRAANGVIMITTKRGRKGKPAVIVSVKQGFMSRGIPEYDRVDSKQYYELFWEAYRNNYMNTGTFDNASVAGIKASNVLTSNGGLVYNAYNVPGNLLVDSVTGKLNPNAQLLWNESWEDALFRQASRTNASLSVSGASDFADYFLSGGYLKEDGIVRNSGYKRYNFRLNVNAKATKWLNTGISLDGALSESQLVPSGGAFTTNPFYYTRNMGPIYPVYQHNTTTGAYVDTLGGHKYDYGVPTQMGTRPYAGNSNVRGTLDLDDRSSNDFNGNGNAFAEIKFTKELSLKATLGVNYFSDNSTTYQNNQYGDAAPATNPPESWGRSTKSNTRQVSLTGNEVLTWKKSFGKNNVMAFVGHENYKYKVNFLSASAAGFLFPGQSELDNGNSVYSTGAPGSNEDNHRIESYFGSVNYDYNQKYLLSGSYRTDGSSKFSQDKRWGTFYSVGLGWRLSQEKFLKNVGWLNELKLRASYGESGNEDLRSQGGAPLYYSYQFYYYSAFGDGSYSPQSRPANADIEWEKNASTDIGMDFTVFNNRLTGTFDWFNKVSDNLLFDVPLPISTGYASVYRNIGTMKNTGIELQLGYNVIRSRDFNWRVDLNLTHFKNEITKLPPGPSSRNGIITGTKKLSIGHGIFDFWLPEYAGVDASNGDALYYKDVLDANGKVTGKGITNSYNQATFYYHGSALPKFSGGFTTSFNYKGFDLSILSTFAYGGLFYDANYAGLMHRGTAGFAFSTDIQDRWQNPGDVTDVPRLQAGIGGQDGASSRWLVDGSYVNIKNVTLSYRLPSSMANHMSLAGAQVFVNVDNAWLFTAKKGMDPQRSFTGTADATYTPFRTVSAGVTVNLQ